MTHLIELLLVLASGLGMLLAWRVAHGAFASKHLISGHFLKALIALAIAVPGLLAAINTGCTALVAVVDAFIAWGIALIYIDTGHGQWQTLNPLHYLKAIKSEFFDALLKPFFGTDPRTTPAYAALADDAARIAAITAYGLKKLYWRCVAGLFGDGALTMLGLGVVLAIHAHPLMGLANFLGLGVGSAASYMLGWKLNPNDTAPKAGSPSWESEIEGSTQIGEAGTGLVLGIILALDYFLLV